LPAHNLLYMEKIGHLKQHQAFQAPMFPKLSDQTHLLKVNDAETKEQKGEKLPLSAGKITGEILAGVIGGLAVGFVGGSRLESTSEGCCAGDAPTELCCWWPIIGGAIGYTLGSAIGVYVVGSIGDETGSFLASLGGSIIGVLGGLVLIEPTFGISFLLGPPIGAAIGFNYESLAESEIALINFRDSQISLAVPTIYFRPDSFDRRILTRRVDFVKMTF